MLKKNILKKFSCNFCDYFTNNKNDFDKHLLTKKHKNNNFDLPHDEYDIESYDDINDIQNFCHICDKNFKTRQGLWYHKNKKKCFDFISTTSNDESVQNFSQLTKLVETLVEENKELKKILIDNNNSSPDCSTKINTQNNYTTQNNTFNLHFFLNETCKDAMNIDDFIDSIEITIQDLKHLGKKGYVEGLSDLFIKNLEELDITKRPLHCSDIKRETVHIKEKNTWEKDNDQKARLTNVVTDITRLNTIALQNQYQKMYPNCLTDFRSKEHEEYGKIAYEAFGGKLDIDKANKKLFRNIVKIITIDKTLGSYRNI